MHSREVEIGLRLAAALADFWRLGSHVRDGVRWLDGLLAPAEAVARTEARARALLAAAGLRAWVTDPEAYLRLSDEALSIYREQEDASGLAVALSSVGWGELQNARLDAAQQHLAEAKELNSELGNRRAAADCANGLAIAALLEARPEKARPLFAEAMVVFDELGDKYYVGLTSLMSADVDRREGRLDAADETIHAALAAFRELDRQWGSRGRCTPLGPWHLRGGNTSGRCGS